MFTPSAPPIHLQYEVAADLGRKGGDGKTDAPTTKRRLTVFTENEAISTDAVIVAMPHHLAGRIRYEPPMPVRI